MKELKKEFIQISFKKREDEKKEGKNKNKMEEEDMGPRRQKESSKQMWMSIRFLDEEE